MYKMYIKGVHYDDEEIKEKMSTIIEGVLHLQVLSYRYNKLQY